MQYGMPDDRVRVSGTEGGDSAARRTTGSDRGRFETVEAGFDD